jgi:DNA-binding NtrC family response regulator
VDAPPSVLVVDDDASIRMLCRVNLELDGINVLEAATLSQARERLAEADVSVVLLDVHVGPESGIDLLRELRRERPGVRVALLTGSEGDSTRDVEPHAVVGKPFTLDELRSTVERLAAESVGSAGNGDDRRAHTR